MDPPELVDEESGAAADGKDKDKNALLDESGSKGKQRQNDKFKAPEAGDSGLAASLESVVPGINQPTTAPIDEESDEELELDEAGVEAMDGDSDESGE